jgi:hypothetical protein
VAGQKLICTRRALAAQSLFRSFTVVVAAWRSDVLDKVFLKKLNRNDCCCQKACILLNKKGFFISVERSDFVEEFVCILLNKKGFAFQLKEVILLKNLFCILLNKKGFAFWSKEMILLKNLVCILLNRKCVFAFELNKEVYVSWFCDES